MSSELTQNLLQQRCVIEQNKIFAYLREVQRIAIGSDKGANILQILCTAWVVYPSL